MKLAVIANPEKYAIKEPFSALINWAQQNRTEVYCSQNLADLLESTGSDHSTLKKTATEEAAISNASVIIALGGDGTMLYTARLSKNTRKPILGVNSGRLGFMANTQHTQICRALDYIKSGNYRLDQRYMLEAKTKNGTIYHALNEFLFSKQSSATMIIVEAYYNDQLINKYWADGLIIASPTGSTAYNLSAFGPIVMPQSNVMVLTAINPHTLTTRPIILPSDKPLRLTVREQRNEVLFYYDGKVTDLKEYPYHIDIKRSNFTVDFIELPDQSYFETLRNKLMWGRDFREQV